jgi:PEP-CTERM motif
MQYAEQFTLTTSVVVDQVKVGMSGPAFPSGGGSFNVTLGPTLGTGTQIGSGTLIYDAQFDFASEIFDFSGLNIPLGPGTYYLQLTGGNVDWAFATPVVTGFGTVGPTFGCDPTVTCPEGRYDVLPGTHTFEIDGTATTPEPSAFALLGTGILGLAGALRRRFPLHSWRRGMKAPRRFPGRPPLPQECCLF